MAPLQEDLEWKARWEERGNAVRRVFGETAPPGHVTSFSWREYILPGACAMTFSGGAGEGTLCMTLGLTQPLYSTDPSYPWEFCVRTITVEEWATDLLYQLVTQWLWEKGEMGFGYQLPLTFYYDSEGRLSAAISEQSSDTDLVGAIRGLFLWADEQRIQVDVSTGNFGLLTVVAVTGDEQELAESYSPAHLMLLFRSMRIRQICDPFRKSVLKMENVDASWSRIKKLQHDDALAELQDHP